MLGAPRVGARLAAVLVAAVLVAPVAALTAPGPVQAQHRLPPGADGWQQAGEPGIRGVTIGPIENTLFPGRGYGTPSSAATLDALARRGVNWVSITPFGRVWDLQSTEIQMDFEAPYEENRAAVRRMIAQAHERGIRVLVIPHLWVEAGGWRGEMDPGSPVAWARYRASYHHFVTSWARDAAAAGADAFSLGVECKSWSGRFGRFWQALIQDVRAIFDGYLTYSANWDEAEDVLFWDQLDLIGINAFYPLHHEEDATFEQYLEGADRARQSVQSQAEVLDMPVLFVEVGYTTREDAAVQPWLWPDDMEDVVVSEREQARALLASWRAFLPHDWFSGFFIWRYYADLDDTSQERVWGFSPHAKLAERVMTRVMQQPFGVDPGPWDWLDAPAPPPTTVAESLRATERLLAPTVVERPQR